ncbi:MAG TPA: hypothetical protein VL484_18115 [Vicinamibacterales bacterium]|jgi:hypothetical protein|nr:hypothetical protein [Vicinamibacterales bacterium]
MRLRNVTMAVGTAALIAIAVPVQAQVWNDGGRRGAYGNDVRSIAYNNGYQEGLNHGEQAARDRHAYDMQREKDYRNADEGYRSEYGNKDLYRDEFRRGFAQGYQEAYARFDNRYGGNNGVWNGAPYPSNGRVYGGVATERGYGYGYGAGRNIAFRNGESDGYQKGLDDARDGKYPQPERQKWYRSANRNYDSRDGISQDEYKNEYRRGFQEGYQQAYNLRRR